MNKFADPKYERGYRDGKLFARAVLKATQDELATARARVAELEEALREAYNAVDKFAATSGIKMRVDRSVLERIR